LDPFFRVSRSGGEVCDAALELLRFFGVRRFPWIDRRELGERPRRFPEPIGRRVFRLRERGERSFARSPDPIRMRQAGAIGKKRLLLPLSRLRRLDLANLEVESLEPSGAVPTRRFESLQRLKGLAPLLRRLSDCLALPLCFHERVEQFERRSPI